MQQYTTPFKAHSVPFKANGVFYGVVVAVNDKRLDIKVPRMTGDAIFKNIEYADSAVTDTPSAGELLLVSFLEGNKDDLVVLGRVKSSLDRPDVDLTGAVAGDFLQYDGTKFIAADIDLGSLTVGNYVATIAGTASEIDVSGSGVEGAAVTLSLPATINANTTGSAATWTTARTISLSGDVTGSASINGSADATITATIAANSVALGTDTTGNYMSGVSAGTGISVSHTPGEGSTATVTNSGVTSLTGTANQVTASASTGAVTLSLPSSINVNTTGSAAKWTTARTISLGGDLTGSALIDGSADATITATIAANSVTLGTDTTGDYVATITAGTNLSISAGSGTGEGSTPTLATSTTPSFSTITSTVPTGTAPLTIASETLVTNLNADRLDGEHGSWYSPSGLISPYAGLTAPPGWLFCNGQSVSRTTYATLFSTLTASVGTCTITTASPAVVSLTAHGLVEGDAIYFTTTGTLPTGLSADTTYYVKSTGNANTFQVSLTRTSSATAFTAGTAVNTTVAGSGTHTVVKAPYGVPSSLNFYVPDFRGRTPVGIDNIGGTDAGLLSLTNALGGAGGVQTVTLDGTQIPSHVHGATGLSINTTGSTHTHKVGNYDGHAINNYITSNSTGPAYQTLVADIGVAPNERITTSTTGSTHTHGITGNTAGLTDAGQLHDNMQPFMLVNYIIKT